MKSKVIEGNSRAMLLAQMLILIGGTASAQVTIVDMDFNGVTGLENPGLGPDGVLKGGASIVAGELVLDGSNQPEPTGAGLDLAISDFGTFSGLGDFRVEFDFATIGGDMGALFSADGAHVFGEGCDGCPGDQEGGLNIYLVEDAVVADFWYIAALNFGGDFADDTFHRVEAFYDSTTTEFSLSVDGGEPSILEVADGDGFMRDTSNDLTRLGDENNPDFGIDFNDGCNCKFDNLRIEGPAPPPVRLTIDRVTGELDLEVIGVDPVDVDYIRIESEAGTLLGDNYDGLGATGGEFSDWTIDTAESERIEEGGSAATISSGQMFALGNGVWRPFFDEDVSVIVNDTGLGAEVGGIVEFVNGAPSIFADLDEDDDVDPADYELFAAGFGSEVSGLTFYDAYFQSDLNGDEVHNFDDWILFIEAFDAFNGAGAFVAMVSGVPEPTSLWLLAVAVLGLTAAHRRRAVLMLAVAVVLPLSAARPLQATTLVEYLFATNFNDTSGNGFHGMPNPNGLSSPTVSGGKLQLTGDIDESLIVPLGAANNPFDGVTSYSVEMDVASLGGFGGAGVILLGSANMADPLNGDNESFAIFIEPQEEEEGEVFGGSLVVDHYFVGEVRVNDALLLDGVEHSIVVSYQAPAEPGDPEEPNPGQFFLNIDGEWLATGEMAPRPAAPHDQVLIGSTPNADFPFECVEGQCLTAELAGTVDNFRVLLDDMAIIPSLLRAEVDATTGELTLLGGEFAREVRYYEINSDGNSLDPNELNSLSDQNIDPIDDGIDTGETWDVLNASSSQIAEAFLLGGSLFTDSENASISLGNIYKPFSPMDLEIIAVTTDNEDIAVPVHFINIPAAIEGDYNRDGIVNAADYVVWRNSEGDTGTGLPADGNGDMMVDDQDYDYWVARFGNTTNPMGSAASVPEPSCAAALLITGIGMVFLRHRHCTLQFERI